jgi:hypothetical protein
MVKSVTRKLVIATITTGALFNKGSAKPIQPGQKPLMV